MIAAYVLEHLPMPHDVLRDWFRVVKPGGVQSMGLPCNQAWPGGWVGRSVRAATA